MGRKNMVDYMQEWDISKNSILKNKYLENVFLYTSFKANFCLKK